MVGTINEDIANTADSIAGQRYLHTGAIVAKQTAEFMEKMLAPILAYADIVKILDPYFSFTPETGDKKRYEKAFEVICANLGNKHDMKSEAIIEIHTSIKPMLNRDKEFVWQKSDRWPQIMKSFEKKYGHKITLYIWEDLKKKDEWHERWIITNQCGIYMGKGSDISNWTDSTWSLLDWEQLPEISNKFDSNRQVYNFIGKIDSTRIIKNQNPKNTSTYITAKEREEKRNKPINLKERREKLRQSRKEAE